MPALREKNIEYHKPEETVKKKRNREREEGGERKELIGERERRELWKVRQRVGERFVAKAKVTT